MTKDELKAKLKELRERARTVLENRGDAHEEMVGNLRGAQEYPKDYDKLDLFVDTLVSAFGRDPLAKGMASGRMSRWCAENAMRDAPGNDACEAPTKGQSDDDQEDREETT